MNKQLIQRYKDAFGKANPEFADTVQVEYVHGQYSITWEWGMIPVTGCEDELLQWAKRLEQRQQFESSV